MRRLLTLLLAILLIALPLASCKKDPPVTEEELLPIARELIGKSTLVNDVMLGGGIPTGSEAFGEYLYADEAWEEEHGIQSVEDILTRVREVYTDPIYNVLYLEAITKDGSVPPDYQNRSTPAEGILVYKGREGWYGDDVTREYLFDTMRMTESTATTARVEITVRITVEGTPTQERTLGLPFVLTERGWRCDKLTCIAYDS